MSIKIFLSSNRNEFIEERLFIKKSLIEDSLLKNWVNVFLFEEDVESSSFPPKEVYISEVRNSDIYMWLFRTRLISYCSFLFLCLTFCVFEGV